MKKTITLLLILYSSTFCFGQSVEFPIYSNGLIYSDSTMKQLEYIVDSLNLKFRSCNINTTYYSKYQATGHYIRLDEGNVEAAVRDMKKNISFEDFLKKYPKTKVDSNLLVIKFKYKNYQNNDEVEFCTINQSHGVIIEEKPEVYDQLVNGKWIFDYWGKDNVSEPFMWGFYFTSEFKKQPIPMVYARMIQYADCLVDTSSQIFKENAIERSYRYKIIDTSKIGEFIKYVNIETNKPVIDKYIDDPYMEKMYYLFLNYNYFVTDEIKKKENIDQLELAIKELPEYLQIQLKTEKHY